MPLHGVALQLFLTASPHMIHVYAHIRRALHVNGRLALKTANPFP
jgi:hypothetical protein